MRRQTKSSTSPALQIPRLNKYAFGFGNTYNFGIARFGKNSLRGEQRLKCL